MIERAFSWMSAAFAMDEATWRRHASPWSVWTRYSALPLIALALYSHVWFGWPVALCGLAVALVWVWLNPRLFPPPAHMETWASKAVLGERVLLARRTVPVPRHHLRAVAILSAITGAGTVVAIAAAMLAEPCPLIGGLAIAIVGKSWLLDRMVWLFEGMKDASPTYRSWLC